MKTRYALLTGLFVLMVFLTPVRSQNNASFEELTKIMDSARVVEADIFAPKAFAVAEKRFEQSREAVGVGKNQKSIDSYVSEAREYAENALKATEVCKLTLKDYLPPRDKARAAKAPTLVPDIYQRAELMFIKATQSVEAGNVKAGLQQAEKVAPFFAEAEMEAVRVDILGTADKLIAKAISDGADKFALSTLDKARTARAKADAILTDNRYERQASVQEAQLAEYEARHASNIAQAVRSLNRNDQAWEKLMLVYEIQMNRVAGSFDKEYLPFDKGPLEAADTLISLIEAQKKVNRELSNTLEKVAVRNKATIARIAPGQIEDEPVKLAEYLDSLVAGLYVEKRTLTEDIMTEKKKLEELEKTHEEVAAELDKRQEKEEKFKKAKQLLNPSEGEILYNAANDIVLRLSGLSFDVSKSDIKDEHIPLLEKVVEIIKMFPGSKLVVEGHTDDMGEPSANLQLSDKRAYEVMKYLRQTLLIPSDDIRSMGFGSEKPVASNKTADGRAKNRRIDIIIMQ